MLAACSSPIIFCTPACPDRIDLREQRRDGLCAETVRLRFVHAARVEVADQLLDAAALRFRGGGLFEDVAELFLGRLAGGPAPAPARHRSGESDSRRASAVGEVEEIGARIDLAIDVSDLHALLRVTVGRSRRSTRRAT